MPYVQRGTDGLVIGIYAQLQPGIAEEFIEDGHDDLKPSVARAALESIALIEMSQPITQRHLRELTLAIAGQAGQVTTNMLNPALPLDESAPTWLAIPVGVRRCVLQERAIRAERAKL